MYFRKLLIYPNNLSKLILEFTYHIRCRYHRLQYSDKPEEQCIHQLLCIILEKSNLFLEDYVLQKIVDIIIFVTIVNFVYTHIIIFYIPQFALAVPAWRQTSGSLQPSVPSQTPEKIKTFQEKILKFYIYAILC